MAVEFNDVPWTREQIWRGSILASIAHAIMVSHFPEIANEHSWDGMNYSVQDSAGTRGTISFHSEYCVAAFRNENSYRMSSGEISSNVYFKGAPPQIIELAETEALQYLLDNVNGHISPVITTAFWGIKNQLFACDKHDLLIENGGFILERHVMDLSDSIDAWVEYYDMNEKQVTLMNSIFKRKISNPKEIIRLTDTEIDMIESENQEDLTESKVSFEEIGVILEV
ncbi:hypothetical protein ACFOZY_09345 [Chungangia koreensis]|uniref:Uncharacterized protein n=1 Tax=Chungangia koreensis TaxID=752657 RepID=A0ABV8X531_9LACT